MEEEDQIGITRRRALTGAAAAGAAVALAAGPESEARTRRKPTAHKPPARRHADVIVVGAGAAGSAAAHAVAKAGKSVIVLEARDRVGGRTLNHPLGPRWPGKIAEIGGTFVGPTQDKIYGLISETGLRTFRTYDTGMTTTILNGHRARISNSDPATYVNISPTGGLDFIKALVQLQAMANEVPVSAPWSAPNAAEWDSQTFYTWVKQNAATPDGRRLLDTYTTALLGCQARDVSLLWTLFYTAAAGNETTRGQGTTLLNNTTGGAQQDRIVGGSQLIWIRIAERLGRSVVLNAPVRHISQSGRGVTVTSAKGVYKGKHVIVAMPPALTARIMYDPQLPALRDQLVQRFPQGSYAKFEAIYPTPFWRSTGSNGQVFGDNGVVISWDASPPDGTPGMMTGFIGGDHARRWDQLDARARRQFGLKALSEYFGPQALRPVAYAEARWTNDLWSRGDPVGFTPPGVLLSFGTALREPVGRIHWAGTETSEYWPGYMEGGVRSGQRAAAEALAAF
jgi:monoamine oxidase